LFSKYLGIFLPDTKNTATGKEKNPIKNAFSVFGAEMIILWESVDI